ncbi:MAG: DUF4832 domain-containing protein [Lachnospiraceae bacterium]|nr:DUF4832 domain-containing protein [Lachnospiraceae bacterium]
MKIKKIAAFLCAFTLAVSGFGSISMGNVKAEEEEAAKPVVVDGNNEDWNYITPIYMGGGVINKVSAFTYEGVLYGKMELSSASQFDTWHIYLETDGDTANHLYFNGADYCFETEILYKYEGDSGEWDGLVGTDVACQSATGNDKKTLEFAIPLDGIGNPESIGVNYATVYNWEDVATNPAAPNEYLTVPTYDEVYSEESMVGLTEQEAETYLASKQFSGAVNQWDSLLYDAVYKNSNVKALKAVSDGEFLYIAAEAKALSNNFTVYIGTDKVTGGTDMSQNWSDAKDMAYQVKANGTLYEMSGNSKKGMGTVITDFFKCDTGFEIKIPLEAIGGLTDEYLIAIEEEGELLPDAGNETLKVIPPILETAPTIKVDGDPSDWAGLEPIGKGEDSLGDIYALRDNENLYVMTTIKGITDPESSAAYTTSLFVDTDEDQTTGFLHSGYKNHCTGDFLLQDWYSYGPDKNIEFFYTHDSVTLEWNMKKQSVEGYDKVIGKIADGEYCAEYIIPIDMMREVTPDISDTLYVCIDRNDVQTDEETFERKTPEGFTPARDTANGSFARVPKYQVTFDLAFDDSDISDWASISNKTKHENLTNLCAVKNDEKLYTLLTSNMDLTTDTEYYITTDEGGFKYGNMSDVTYFIERGKLYKVTADDTLAEDYINVYQYYDASYILMQVYMDWIGNPKTVKVAADVNSGTYLLPEEGYLNVNSVVEVERDENLFYPVENYDLYNNPFKGWVGWGDINEGDIDTIAVDYNLMYVDIKWSELEKEKGVYDFESIEKQYQFDKWRDKGARMVFRFVMDNPNYIPENPDMERMDIPQWLYDELLEENAEDEGAGVFYNGETILNLLGGIGFSPNYKSKLLLDYHRKAIEAIAERYDDPSICAYVEVGSLGHWAEFHTWPTGTGEFPNPELAQQYMQPYVDYFHNVKVGIRKPYALSKENNWGLYNDVFGVGSDGATPTFLEWAATGNTDMPEGTEDDIKASAMPEWWKLNYSGGEFSNGDFRINAQDSTICAVLDQIRDSHTTWLGPCSGCDLKVGQEDNDKYLYNAEVMFKTMGYRYNLVSITKDSVMAPGKSYDLALTWNNSGVAPIYYNCPVTVYLVNSDGESVASAICDGDTTEWLPGRSSCSASLEIPADLKEGEYTLAVKMVTGDDNAQAISLAMEGQAEDGGYVLYPVNVSSNEEEVAEPAESSEEESAVESTESVEEPAKKTNTGVIVAVCVAALALIGGGAYAFTKKKKDE